MSYGVSLHDPLHPRINFNRHVVKKKLKPIEGCIKVTSNRLLSSLLCLLAVILIINGLVIAPDQYLDAHFPVSTAIAQPAKIVRANLTKGLDIVLLTDALFSDAGWGAFGYNAVQALHNRYGYSAKLVDNVPIPEIENTLRNYANQGYDLVIAQGFEWGEPAMKVGKDYPDTKFVVFTGLANSTNVASIFPMQQEGTYLLGALAAMMSKTGVIGFVGGERYPNLLNMYEGYSQGAKDIDPDTKVLATYLDDWDNPVKGKNAALSQIADGADVLLHVADTSGQGVIQAAKESGIYAFGAVSDQNKLAPNTVVTSFVLDVEKAFDLIINMVQNEKFTGQTYKPGLELARNGSGDGIVYIAPFHNFEDKIPKNIKSKFEQLRQGILNGTIVVPERYSVK